MATASNVIRPDHAAFFLDERGIAPSTLEAYGAYSKGEAIFFPYPNGEKKRPMVQDPERRFYFTEGRKPVLLPPPRTADTATSAFLVEGETDAMRLWQELDLDGDPSAGVFALSGVDTWRPELLEQLDGFDRVFVVLDNEDDYMKRDQVEDAWRRIRRDLGQRGRRLRLPVGVKDVCEFFSAYDLETLRLLAQKGSQVSRFAPLDLSRTPPPASWLLEGLVARGDVTLLAGASGLGKSWVTMGLTVATVEAHATFLGADLKAHGKVLYVDEENPEDVIYTRLKQLGLTSAGMANVRYLWNQGIRLDKEPEKLIDEALDFRPSLIVLDSLTRLHGKEENNAGDMADLFNNGIKPLARETGAAVALIHHHDKGANGPRGSGDILAAADAGLDVYSGGPGAFRVKLSKSRRRIGGDEIMVKITDLPDGSVRLMSVGALDAPF